MFLTAFLYSSRKKDFLKKKRKMIREWFNSEKRNVRLPVAEMYSTGDRVASLSDEPYGT